MSDPVTKGKDAAFILNSDAYKDAWGNLKSHVDKKALSCDPDDKDQAIRVVITMQLLTALEREFDSLVEEGQAEEAHNVMLWEEEQQRSKVREIRR